jgi:hypothetical protein
MQTIKKAQTPAYILTRGTQIRQVSKLRAAGLYDFPHVITDELVKSQLINETRTPEGIYAIEAKVGVGGLTVLRARGGTLVEDRPKGLVGLNVPEWNGILVRRGDEDKIRPGQRGDAPEGVIKLPSLDPITERIIADGLVGDLVRERL